ncbi:MAG: 4-alpha-glucanotransferase [Candidatus Heteroscillospira sp.]|jgi:4-alpha-glucanotransferase
MGGFQRCSGILMPVSALPSPYGIGTLGRAAFEFADFLHESGQSLWQILPLGPTGFGDSPYQSFSSFAGNPYLIDLDELAEAGLLLHSEINAVPWGSDSGYVDYGLLYSGRLPLLALARERGRRNAELCAAVETFSAENAVWLNDYALFMALKRHFNMRPWHEWPEDIRSRESEAMEHYRRLLRDDLELECFIQYCFFTQFYRLRGYCRSIGLRLVGDLPFYTAPDSADVWAAPEQFQLDSHLRPTCVAGVPPDFFSENGQLWGNPLYDWERMSGDGFSWWRKRVAAAARLYDIIRLDHFRGFESYWSIPAGAESAAGGRWVKAPGTSFIKMLKDSFPQTMFVAEDLGIITDDVRALRSFSGFPGMAVLSFAFDPEQESSYLPHKLERSCFCCTGTHDNEPLGAFCANISDDVQGFISLYCGGVSPLDIIRSGMCSPADVFIAQLQDWLEADAGARMNTPGLSSGCWQWRLTPGQLTQELKSRIFNMTKATCRLNTAAGKECPHAD